MRQGLEDEDHLIAAIWNLQAILWTLEECRARRLPQDLVDLPYAFAFDPVAGTPKEKTCGFCKVPSEDGQAHARWCKHAPPSETP